MREHYPVKMDYLVRRVTFCGWKIDARYLDCYELVFIVSGEGKIMLQDRTFIGKAGDMIVIRPGELNSFAVDSEPCMVFYGVHFLPIWKTEDDRRPQPLADSDTDMLPLHGVMHIQSPHKLENLFRELYQVYQQKAYLHEWRQNILLEQILCELCEIQEQKNAPAEYARIRRVLDHIHEEPYRSYTLDELLEIAGVKKSLFLQEFRNVTGTTPIQYVMDLRLGYARELLLETDAAIAQIAQQCGFEDVFYFSRCFKKRFHMSPRAYRKGI